MAGTALVHLQGAGGSSPAHELLARRFRVIALETPPDQGREAAGAIGRALDNLGLADVDLMATGDGSTGALWFALEQPDRVRALVLEAPTAVRCDAELERRLPEVATPTLVLFGTSDQQAAQDTGRVYTGRMPNSHLVYVYGAGHAIGRDRPEAFAEVVVDFLERHEAFIISRTPTVIHP